MTTPAPCRHCTGRPRIEPGDIADTARVVCEACGTRTKFAFSAEDAVEMWNGGVGIEDGEAEA